MAGFNYAQNIIGLKKGAGDIHELELSVADLSASVLEIKGDITNLEDSKLKAVLGSITINSTDTGAIKAYEIPTIPSGYVIVGVVPVSDTPMFNYYTAKNPRFLVETNSNLLDVRVASGNVGDTENRTLRFYFICQKSSSN